MIGIKVYLAECAERALFALAAFAMSFLIGAGLSMGVIWGTLYMHATVMP